MMNIEDWLASATDELMEARTGHTIARDINTWSDLSARLEYLTIGLSTLIPEDTSALISEIASSLAEVQEATEQARDAAKPATSSSLGLIKIGDSLTIDNAGVANTIQKEYTLSIPVNGWTFQNSLYTYTISNISNITANTRCIIYLDNSYFNLISNLSIQTTDQSTIIFSTANKPIGIISGKFTLQRILT